ncbi:MAG: hypothetical protein ACFFCV_10320 [Promethearchaeota archaeon]
MKQVKGTMVITIVKSIKANINKREEYNKLLSEKAKNFLQNRILSSTWYPFEEYRECFDTLCFIEAKNNPIELNKWGHLEANRWLTTIYQATVVKGDPQLAVKKYSRFHEMVFNFGKIVSEIISDTEIDLTYLDFIKDWENFYHIAVGWAQTYIELSIDRKIDFRFLKKSWKGEGWTKVRLSWSS